MADSIHRSPWPWRDIDPAIQTARSNVELRKSALVQFLIMLGVAFVLKYVLGRDIIALIIGGFSICLLILGLGIPRIVESISNIGKRFGLLTGQTLGWLLLTPLYYLVFMPVGFYLKLAKRDPLHRSFRPQGYTYWIRRHCGSDTDFYSRQFMSEDKKARAELRLIDATDKGIDS